MEEAKIVLGDHVATVLAYAAHLQRGPNGVAGEELVVGWYAGELHHAELHHQVVDELLGVLLCQGALVEIALYVYVEESGDTSHRHGRAVLGLHRAEVTEVEPLHGLARVCRGLRDVEAIERRHVFQSLEGLYLHGHFLAQAYHVVYHLALAHVQEVVVLLLDQEVDAIECHATVVAHDATAPVGVGQASEDMVVAHALHLRGVSVKHAVVVGLHIVMEYVMQLLRGLVAVGGASLFGHLYAAIGHKGTLERLVGLQAYHLLQVFRLVVDVTGAIGRKT